MDYGIKVRRLDGSVKMDGLTRGGVFVEILTIANGASGSKSYPRTFGNSLFYYTAQAGGHRITIDSDSSGAGRINWTATDTNTLNGTVLYVFTNRVVSSDLYGLRAVNDGGETQADNKYCTPQFVATLTLQGAAQGNYTTPDGYTVYLHSTTAFDLRSTSDKIVLMALPDVGTNDTWYSLRNECIPASAGSTVITVAVYTKAGSYTLPSLHLYAINNLQPSSGQYGLRIKDPATTLTYDSGSEPITVKDAVSLSYPGPGETNTYTLSYSVMPGLSLPYYYRNVQSGSNATRYAGAAKRVGNQLTVKLALDFQASNASTDTSWERGSQINRYCPVVDLSALGPSNVPGTPGGTTYSPPAFTASPLSRSVTPGTTTTFSVTVTGNPAPALQWYRNNSPIAGATSANYSLTAQLSDNGAVFRCTASSSMGSVDSASATLTVQDNTPPPVTPVTITSSPSSQSVTAGQTASFSVTVSGTAPVSISWYKNGSYVGSGFSYSFTTAIGDNGSTIYCVATNGNGAYSATSSTATLAVTQTTPPASIYQHPSSVTVTQGQSASMSCGATNANNYTWYRDGVNVASGSTISLDTSVVGTFTYFCRVFGTAGGFVDSSGATLIVSPSAQGPYTSYNNLSGSLDLYDGDTGAIDVYRDGSAYVNGSYIGRWGNGSSTGTMYTASGSGAGVGLEPGSDSFGTSYFFTDRSSVSFVISGGQYDGKTKNLTATVTLRLNGNVVATVTVSIKITSQLG